MDELLSLESFSPQTLSLSDDDDGAACKPRVYARFEISFFQILFRSLERKMRGI